MNHIHIDFARKGVIFINTEQKFYIKPNRFFFENLFGHALSHGIDPIYGFWRNLLINYVNERFDIILKFRWNIIIWISF